MNTNTRLVKFYKMCGKQFTLQLSPWITLLFKVVMDRPFWTCVIVDFHRVINFEIFILI